MSSQATATKHEPSSSKTTYAEPKRAPEHDWLETLVSEWETEMECHIEAGKPPLKSKGTESVRSIGGFWIVAEGKSIVMDKPMTSILTLGYDSEQRKYVGTWASSCMTYLWQYKGSLDLASETLTLETEGPSPLSLGTIARFREVMEVINNDHRVFTSSVQRADGKWAKIATISYRRKK